MPRSHTVMQKILRCALAVAFVALASSSAIAGELKLSLNNGLVTIIADEVPVSRILSEWARIGQTKIVNGEQLMTVVSLQIIDVPERKALDILLRSASGYMAAERPTPLAGASAFDRVMILPFSRPPAAPPVPAANAMPPPFSQPQPRPMPMMPQPEPVDDDPVMAPGVGPQLPTQPGPQTVPNPGVPFQTMPGQQQPVLTAPRPGQLPQPAPQQPVPFGTPVPPGAKPKPGGGGEGTGA